MGLAHLLSKVTTPIFMGVIYFVVLTPTAWLMRLFGRRSLVHPEVNGSFWIERGSDAPEPSRMEATILNLRDDAMSNSGLMGELWAFMKVRKKFWLLPIIVIMVLVGTLLVFAQGSVLAPFIYTIF